MNRESGWWFELLLQIWKSVEVRIPNIWNNKNCSKPPTRNTTSTNILLMAYYHRFHSLEFLWTMPENNCHNCNSLMWQFQPHVPMFHSCQATALFVRYLPPTWNQHNQHPPKPTKILHIFHIHPYAFASIFFVSPYQWLAVTETIECLLRLPEQPSVFQLTPLADGEKVKPCTAAQQRHEARPHVPVWSSSLLFMFFLW